MATKPLKKPAGFTPCSGCKTVGKCAAMKQCAGKSMKAGKGKY
jgi:hypothetical protein